MFDHFVGFVLKVLNTTHYHNFSNSVAITSSEQPNITSGYLVLFAVKKLFRWLNYENICNLGLRLLYLQKNNKCTITSIRLDDKRFSQGLFRFALSRNQWSVERKVFRSIFYSLYQSRWDFLVSCLSKQKNYWIWFCFKLSNLNNDLTLCLSFKFSTQYWNWP